ncbi:unnamed protein product [Cochlearia groenlandica]
MSTARPWYRFSSIVRPTPRSSRHQSPPGRRIIEPPTSSATPHSPPLPPKEVQKAKPSLVTFSRSMKQEPPKTSHDHETTHHNNILTSSEKTNMVHESNEEQQQHESDHDVITGKQGVINISGENKGAIMEILRSPRQTRGVRKDVKEELKSKKHSNINNGDQNNIPMDGFVNSNVQLINSSVVYNSTEAYYDPGVHLSLHRNPNSGNGFIIKDHGKRYNRSTN